jgi:hypothetical protein
MRIYIHRENRQAAAGLGDAQIGGMMAAQTFAQSIAEVLAAFDGMSRMGIDSG